MTARTFPAWIKPAVISGAAGAVGAAIFGFAVLDWHTSHAAETMAELAARNATTAALVPVCIARANEDPSYATTMEQIVAQKSWDRDETLKTAGWATMPGSESPNQLVADACVKALMDEREA